MNKVINHIDVEEKYIQDLFGNLDEHINMVSQEFKVSIKLNDGKVEVSGDEIVVRLATDVIINLCEILKNDSIDSQKVRYVISQVKESKKDIFKELDYTVCMDSKLKPIRPKTVGQYEYVESILKNIVTFGIGPAGTGKTFLAIAIAVKALKNNEVSRIVLTRPAVEAGENLGFLPGDLQEKIDPYLRPLYDALYTVLGYENFLKLKEKNIIEVAPLAYMRGRTLDNAFIILDEAQNTTNEQMKMFLTRIGFGSKAVVTGDITQIDLHNKKKSGLANVKKILSNIKGINIHEFNSSDVVRHSIVMKIIDAYSKYENN